MLQRHSYHELYYHLVFATKNREPFIRSLKDGEEIRGYLQVKAESLDAYLEEFGCWREHVHILLRSSPKNALSDVYGQMKGFCSRARNLKHPDFTFGWQDGVYAVTVDPDNNDELREYIRSQWNRHETGLLRTIWEPDIT